MKIIHTEQGLLQYREECRSKGRSFALVPTMGFLHEGHLSLVKVGAECCDEVMVYIYVNPTQFNRADDLQAYPVDLERDFAMLRERKVDAVFTPNSEMIYGPDFQSWVDVARLSEDLEGAGRPGHFRGVSTVLSIMFHLVSPDVAVFGEKDFQQVRVVEQMVQDLRFPLRIVRGPLIRDHDGLALSSRNIRLDADARKKALHIPSGLQRAFEAFQSGERRAQTLEEYATKELRSLSDVSIHYSRVVDEVTLQPLTVIGEEKARLLTAVDVADVRLLDNIALHP